MGQHPRRETQFGHGSERLGGGEVEQPARQFLYRRRRTRRLSKDPASSARYSIAVSFEVIGKEIPIYEDLRVAVEVLQVQIQAEVEAEAVVEVET